MTKCTLKLTRTLTEHKHSRFEVRLLKQILPLYVGIMFVQRKL
jgi:hypothetical protein